MPVSCVFCLFALLCVAISILIAFSMTSLSIVSSSGLNHDLELNVYENRTLQLLCSFVFSSSFIFYYLTTSTFESTLAGVNLNNFYRDYCSYVTCQLDF